MSKHLKRREAESVAIEPMPKPERLNISQESWDATPAVLQSEICRMLQEMSAGIEKYRPAAARDAELAEYYELAEAGGTTLPKMLRHFIDLETLLRQDATAGIFKLCENMGIDPLDLLTRYARGEAA